MVAAAFSMIPVIGSALVPVVERLASRVGHEWSRSRRTIVKAAAEEAGLSPEDLAEAIEAEPRLVPLFSRVMMEATTCGDEKTLLALGVAFGEAVKDSEKIDEVELLLMGIRNLRANHFLVLKTIIDDDYPPNDGGKTLWHMHVVADACKLDLGQATLLVTGLMSAGFLTPLSYFNGTGYVASELGIKALEVVDRVPRPPD